MPLVSAFSSRFNPLKYPTAWLRNILQYVRVPQSTDDQEDVSHFIDIPDNPYVDPVEAMRFFIMENSLYVKLNPATDYKRVYNELSKHVQKQIEELYQSGAVVVSKGFAKQWGLKPYIIPSPQNFPDKIEFTDDELSDIINVNLDMYPFSGVPDIVPKNPPDIADIINYSIWTEGNESDRTEAVGEPETQLGLSGSEALQNFSRRIYVQEYEYRDSLRDTSQTALYIPTWTDGRIAPNIVDFLMERLANIPYFRLKIKANYVEYHIAAKECNKLNIIPQIEDNYIYLPAKNVQNCQKLASIIYHAIRTSTLGKVIFFAFGSKVSTKNKDLYEELEGFTKDIDKHSTVSHYTTNDPLKPYIYTMSVPVTSNGTELTKGIHDKIFSK